MYEYNTKRGQHCVISASMVPVLNKMSRLRSLRRELVDGVKVSLLVTGTLR